MTTDAPADALRPLAELDRTLHEPGRLLIMAFLWVVKSADFLFLLRQTGLTRGNLSISLTKLEEAGFVIIKKEFVDKVPRTLIRLSARGRNAIQSYRKQMQQVIDGLSITP